MIDTHHHNWILGGKVSYDWITPGTILYYDFTTVESKRWMDLAGVEYCVLMEARNSLAELEWMLEQQRIYPHMLGVVGGGELYYPDTLDTIRRFADQPAYKGVRIYWEEPGQEQGSLDEGLLILATHDLTCDIVMKPQAYAEIADAIERHPKVRFILDHFAGARVLPGEAQVWDEQIARLASLPNTTLKLSGYLTAAKPPTLETIQPYFDVALKRFGASRMLYGSDYPVCTVLGQSYVDTVDILRGLIAPLSEADRDAITDGTARRIYRL